MGDDNHGLSICLYKTLESIGASERLRHRTRGNAIVNEICINVSGPLIDWDVKRKTTFCFGSKFEGTTTPGLASDMDMLQCATNHEVILDPLKFPSLERCFVIVRDETTQPGYVRLQVVVHGEPQTVSIRQPRLQEEADCSERICLKHDITVAKDDIFIERNGPAATEPGTKYTSPRDFVSAYSCQGIPDFGMAWTERKRDHGWPSRELLVQMMAHCCFFVGVGHPLSPDNYLEWRISFSLQERELMMNLNPTQHKCYILLKMVKKDIIEPNVGTCKTISSYHCKTVLFYTIENTPQDTWTTGNLIHCVILCITRLFDYLKQSNCPNYFIPDENMFDRLDKQTIQQTESVVETILAGGCKFLFDIQCDNVGQLLQLNLSHSDECQQNIDTSAAVNFEHLIFTNMLCANARVKLSLIEMCNREKVEDTFDALKALIRYFDNLKEVSIYKQCEVQNALRYITPSIHLQIVQCILVIRTTVESRKKMKELVDAYESHMKMSESCSFLPRRLTCAIGYYQLQDYDEFFEILDELHTQVKESIKSDDNASFVMSACGCQHNLYVENATKDLMTKQDISHQDLVRSFSCGCVIILPCQVRIVHKALHYELFRSVFIENDQTNKETEEIWFDWIVVDSKIYLFFLHYVFAIGFDKNALQTVIDNLNFFVKTDPNLGHGETAYNLLGWVYMQENEKSEAFKCFVESLKIRPHHNAAKWHILCLMHSYCKNIKAVSKESIIIYSRIPIHNTRPGSSIGSVSDS